MKIITWNVFEKNLRIKNALDYILKLNPDVVCLQEVSHNALKYIKTKNYYLNYTTSSESIKEKNNIYNVILSKKNITNKGTFENKVKHRKTFWGFTRSKILKLTIPHNKGLYIDVGNTRIFNLHLSAHLSPEKRIQQMKLTLKNLHNKNKNVICGDFNSMGNLPMNILLSPFVSIHPKYWFYNERKYLNKLIEDNGFNNIFKGKVTYAIPPFRFQLDHILIQKNIKVISKKVIKKTFFSDHRMCVAELDL